MMMHQWHVVFDLSLSQHEYNRPMELFFLKKQVAIKCRIKVKCTLNKLNSTVS